MLFLYILSIADRRFGGHPYLCSTLVMRTWFGLVRRSADCGELSCLRNCSLCSPFCSHSFSRVSAKPMINNRNNTGAMMSTCFSPTSNGIVVSDLPIFNLTLLFLYILSIADSRFGGHPYLCSTLMMRTWFDVSNAFTKSSNRTHVGRLWVWRKRNNVYIVKLPSWTP